MKEVLALLVFFLLISSPGSESTSPLSIECPDFTSLSIQVMAPHTNCNQLITLLALALPDLIYRFPNQTQNLNTTAWFYVKMTQLLLLLVSWEYLEQIPNAMLTFVKATFVHIRNISAVTDPMLTKLYRNVSGIFF